MTDQVTTEQEAFDKIKEALKKVGINLINDAEARKMEAKAKHLMEMARVAIALDEPFYGVILFNLEEKIAWDMPTMATDGVHLFYNPAFVCRLTSEELVLGLCHECTHVALKHPIRFQGRNKELTEITSPVNGAKIVLPKFQVATDYVVNWLLQQDKYKIPEWALLDPKYADKSAEEIFNQLSTFTPPPEQDGGGEGEGEGQGDQEGSQGSGQSKGGKQQQPGKGGSDGRRGAHPCAGNCSVLPHPGSKTEEGRAEAENQTDTLLRQAEIVAKGRGKVPGRIAQTLEKARAYQVDYRRVLAPFVRSSSSHSDYNWSRPSRSLLAATGVPLPSLWDEGKGKGVVVRDTSGSCADLPTQEQFLGELNGVLASCLIEKIMVIDCDADVQQTKEYESYELPIPAHELKGFGGTDFRPPFQWVEENMDWKPDFLIYLTDLEGPFPDKEPGYPVLWVTTHPTGEAPFGLTCRLNVREE